MIKRGLEAHAREYCKTHSSQFRQTLTMLALRRMPEAQDLIIAPENAGTVTFAHEGTTFRLRRQSLFISTQA